MRRMGFILAATAATAASAEQRTTINPVDLDYRYNFEQLNEGISYRTGLSSSK
jgi:hypothetical protein